MTAHELAAVLLAGPDHTVSILKYMGGEYEVKEIKSAVEYHNDFTGPYILLQTYKEEKHEH